MTLPTKPSTAEAPPDVFREREMLHWYPPGEGRPRRGDRALCGRIKNTPTRWATAEDALRAPIQHCLVCADLNGMG